jgi:hypothetical protein
MTNPTYGSLARQSELERWCAQAVAQLVAIGILCNIDSGRMALIIWSGPENPSPSVSRALGIERWQLRSAIHASKDASGLGGPDRVTIWDDGTVTDDRGDTLGNLYDEL